ncbi:hypothetical protein RJT34_14932 [Clitoria ternatea]|uniref:phosphopyruvate hydratase n=1 Tax=Clitoria ternatea TaxID=43366 RepID=A0AAN9PNF3_CLITE
MLGSTFLSWTAARSFRVAALAAVLLLVIRQKSWQHGISFQTANLWCFTLRLYPDTADALRFASSKVYIVTTKGLAFPCSQLKDNNPKSTGCDLKETAISKAGYTGKVVIGMDVGTSEFYDNKSKTYD